MVSAIATAVLGGPIVGLVGATSSQHVQSIVKLNTNQVAAVSNGIQRALTLQETFTSRPLGPLVSYSSKSSQAAGVLVRADAAIAAKSLETQKEVTKEKDLKKEIAKTSPEQMQKWIEEIRGKFKAMNDGEITISPYDTAWVALVPAFDGSSRPEFPKSLQWILNNQLADGSWGDAHFFSFYDRILNTVACIVALKTWSSGSSAVERGVKFIQQNLHMLETEEEAHMMIGFEMAFPAMMADAKKLGLDLPYDSPVTAAIENERQKKLKKIPIDIVHKFPTTILHTLEGFHAELDWNKLIKLQNDDGSFLNSPAATAACLLHVRDEKALSYLTYLLDRFDNAVPNVYPVDLFEHMWIVDRIQRLGIDRYFKKEIKDSLDYVYKYFKDVGIGWSRGASVQDLDDTAMGFRLLRQHGYDVSENVFKQFRTKNGEFVCFAGQSGQAVTGLFNFYRATQTRFPGEQMLADAEKFARSFLEAKVEANECYDKWIIAKDLAGEVNHALSKPWYTNFPILETSVYLHQYGPDDIWIGKSLYRMPTVNNETFLALAKADFNACQSLRQKEIPDLLSWNEDCQFGTLSFVRQRVYDCFFNAVLMFPDPEFIAARAVFTKNCVLATVMDDLFDVAGELEDLRKFTAATRAWDPTLVNGASEETKIAFYGVYQSINDIVREGSIAQKRDIGPFLRKIWTRWVESAMVEAEWTASSHWPTTDEYMKVSRPSIALEVILLGCLDFLKVPTSAELMEDPEHLHMMDLVSDLGRLLNDIQGYKRESSQGKPNAVTIFMRENPGSTAEDAIAKLDSIVRENMVELVRFVHTPSHIPDAIKQAHFDMARSMFLFYHKVDGYSDIESMKGLVKQILYQPVA